MDQLALKNAIDDETLPNADALIELYSRRDYYAAADHSEALLTSIASLFDAAVLKAKKAVARDEPVVKILKKVFMDVGRLVQTAQKTEKEGKPVNNESFMSGATVQKASGAKMKHELPIPGGKHDTRALPRSRSVSPSTSFTAAISKSRQVTFKPTAIASASRPAERPPSPPPNETIRKHRNTLPKEPAKKSRRQIKTYKSAVVIVNSDDSDIEMPTITPAEVVQPILVVDPSEGLSGFENLDENGAYVNKPHGRLLLVSGKWKPALIVKLKLSPEKLYKALYGGEEQTKRKRAAEAKKLKPKLSSSITPEGDQVDSDRSSDLSLLLSSPRVDAAPSKIPPLAASELVSDDEDPVWESDTDRQTMQSPAVTFPNFPVLSAAHLPLFIKGLITAIENIVADHADNPSATVLEIVQELEENKPTLPAGSNDRRIVMNGGEYVYEAVHQICADTHSNEDVAKDSGVDADGDTNMVRLSSDHVKLTNNLAPITALPEKVYYRSRGRAWKKAPEDADPGFHVLPKLDMKSLPNSFLGRRKATRSPDGRGEDVWADRGFPGLFERFCAHVKREYWFQAGRLGVKPDKDDMPAWLWEN